MSNQPNDKNNLKTSIRFPEDGGKSKDKAAKNGQNQELCRDKVKKSSKQLGSFKNNVINFTNFLQMKTLPLQQLYELK